MGVGSGKPKPTSKTSLGWRRRTTTNLEIERICLFLKLVVGDGGAEQPPTSKMSRRSFSGLVVGGGRAEQPPTSKTSATV